MRQPEQKLNVPLSEVILTKLGSHVFQYNENDKLDAVQNKIWREALCLTMLCWHDQLSLLGVDTLRHLCSVIKLLTDMIVVEVVSVLKELDSLLTRTVKDVPNYTSCHFKHDIKTVNCRAGQIVGLFSRAVVGWFDNEDQHCFRILHCCFSFLTRVNLPGLITLQMQAAAEYIAHEQLLKSYDEQEAEYECFLKDDLEIKIVNEWFPSKDFVNIFAEFEGRHGSGSVADRLDETNIHQKYLHMNTDVTLDLFRKRLIYRDLQGRVIDPGLLPLEFRTERLVRCSKVVFVPKSADKLRTISMEPVSLQWHQQGVTRAIRKWIEKPTHPLSRRISLEDQSLSRDAAFEGSLDGHFATIDLSNASDSVRWSMVRRWFKTTALMIPFHCTRSKYVSMKGRKSLEIRKFAPMGSAICFPAESIIFCAIVEAAITEAGGSVNASRYRVYGDDIIVEEEFAQAVIQRLLQHGFSINMKKTFVGRGFAHNFRESCGGDFLDGLDVTPLRISRKFTGFSFYYYKGKDGKLYRDNISLPSQVERLREMCNECYTRLPSVRLFLIQQLIKQLHRDEAIFFDSTGEGAFFSPEPTNHHLMTPEWNFDLQRLEFSHGRSSARKTKPFTEAKHGVQSFSTHESVRYYEWLRCSRHRRSLLNPEDIVEVDILSLRDASRWRVVNSVAVRYTSEFACVIPSQKKGVLRG